MKVLLTSGGTKVMIDRVRHIGNMSNGTFGAAIAREILETMEHDLIFLKAQGSKAPFRTEVNWAFHDCNVAFSECQDLRALWDKHKHRYHEYSYKTFDEYVDSVEDILHFGRPDCAILAAAVSDYGVSNYVDGKVRSSSNLSISLEPAPKVISYIRKNWPNTKIIGFKLLVDSTDDELITAARKSVMDNDCEYVVANDLRDIQNSEHRLLIVGKDGSVVEHKTDLARAVASLLEKI